MNSPSALSRVKPLTVPVFMVITSWAEAPYMVKPDATRLVPGRRMSSFLPVAVASSLKMAKMVPTDTPASRLLLPSIGSQATAYVACLFSSNTITSSSSSETSSRHFPDPRMAATKTSFPITSNFFWSSPVVFEEPARPVRLISVDLRM